MLGLLREAGVLAQVTVVTLRHAAFPERYGFADGLIADWDLRPLVIYHRWNSIICGNGQVDLVGTIRVRGSQIHMPVANVRQHEHAGHWLCALDNKEAPEAELMRCDFDLVLLGSKNGDVDPTVGAISVPNTVEVSDDGVALMFPLRIWSDRDVWEFIRERGIPFDGTRYKVSEGGAICDDPTFGEHPEYLPVCTACVNPANTEVVWCPKAGEEIPSCGRSVIRREFPIRRQEGSLEVVAF